MADIDILFEKIFEVTRTLADSNGRILTFLEITERKIPDKEEIAQLRASIGKSDKTIVELLEMSKLTIKDIQKTIDVLKFVDLQGMQDDVTNIFSYVEILKKAEYTLEDIAILGGWSKDIKIVVKHTKFINKWGKLLIGVIAIILFIVNYWSAFITVFTKLLGP